MVPGSRSMRIARGTWWSPMASLQYTLMRFNWRSNSLWCVPVSSRSLTEEHKLSGFEEQFDVGV